jgi:hypothetical protein
MRPLAILLLSFLAALEAGVFAWRHVGITPSTAPVFFWKGAPLLTTAPPPFGDALKMYRADRGAEQSKELPEGRKMTLFYFEWDRIQPGPFDGVSGHEVQICNVEHGSFKLLQGGGKRIYRAPNGEQLYLTYTLLAEPNDKPVYVYKIPWIQGFGEWDATDSGRDRTYRLRRSFLRYCGAARVIQAGIFGAASEDEAYALFQHEVLDKLEWAAR